MKHLYAGFGFAIGGMSVRLSSVSSNWMWVLGVGFLLAIVVPSLIERKR